jgi:hypothetical protein
LGAGVLLKEVCPLCDAVLGWPNDKSGDLADIHAVAVEVFRAEVLALSPESIKALMQEFRKNGKIVKDYLQGLSQISLKRLGEQMERQGRCAIEIGGVVFELLPSHLNLQKTTGSLGWAKAKNGCLAAAGAPGAGGALEWARQGATCVVTLLRSDEPAFCPSQRGISVAGLHWEHVALSGRGAVTDPNGEDLASWRILSELLPRLLEDGAWIVVHCAAGMHRTGATVFRALRMCNFSASDVLTIVERMRPVTHGALLESDKNGKSLWQLADALDVS